MREKDIALRRQKGDLDSFKELALEAEEELNKEIRRQTDVNVSLTHEITNLRSNPKPSENFFCEDCASFKDRMISLQKEIDTKTIEISDLISESDKLTARILKLQHEITDYQTSGASTTKHDIQTQTIPCSINEIPSAQQQQKKILLLSDSQGRLCGTMLKDCLDGIKFSPTSIFKPNACFEDIVLNVHKLVSNFNKSDYVIIFGGSNNAMKKLQISSHFLELLKEKLSHTNIILILTPFWHKHINFNNMVLRNNLLLISTFQNTATIVDTSKLLHPTNFTKHGLHLNHSGKRKLMLHISRLVTNTNFSADSCLEQDKNINISENSLTDTKKLDQQTPNHELPSTSSDQLHNSTSNFRPSRSY